MIHYTEFGQHCHLSSRRSPDRSLRPPFANVINTDGSTGSPILRSHRESAVLRTVEGAMFAYNPRCGGPSSSKK